MWKAFLGTPATAELSDFVILLLGMSVNQVEHSFSDLKIKKNLPPKSLEDNKAWENGQG